MADRPGPGDTAGLHRRGRESLRAEIEAARSELAELHRDIAAARAQLGHADPERLMQANQQLVLAAMRADDIALQATKDLQRLRRMSGQNQDSLRDANEQLVLRGLEAHELEARSEAAHRKQVRFLATVAHELRNPLSPIRTAAQLLARAGGDPATLARLQGIIERQAAHMTRLVEDLLDAARGDVGAFRMERQVLDLRTVLEQALETTRPAIAERGQTLLERLPTGPILVDGDPTRLAQVFCNLLDNARKYTPRGGEVALTALAGLSEVTVSVADDGMGIAPEALTHVFDMFARESRAPDVDRSGLGIGLAVVRSLVEAHGGRIEAHSAGPDRGSEFVVSLPLASPAA